MLVFLLTFMLGVGEMLLLNMVFKSVFASDVKKVLIFVALKLILYAAVVVPVIIFMKDSIIPAAVGFCVGLPGAAIVYAVVSLRKKTSAKGDDSVGNTSDN